MVTATRNDPAALTDLYIGGVEPDIGPVAFQRAVQESLDFFIDLAAQPGYLALGDTAHAHGLDKVIDGTSGNTLNVGFLDDGGQRLFRHPAWFEKTREVTALAQFRDAQFDGPGTGLPVAIAVAIAVVEPVRRPHARRRAGAAFDFQFHQTLGGKADHMAQEVRIGGLLQKALKVHGLSGHRWVLGFGFSCGDQTLPKIRDDRRCG